MDRMRSVIRRGLRAVGLSKIHHPAIADLIRHEGIHTVFDVGANVGHYGVELREGGYRGRIISFEPAAKAFAALSARAGGDRQWDAFQLGVGDRAGELSLTVTEADVFSSFKPPNDYTANKFVGAREAGRELVPVTRLDEFVAERPSAASQGPLYLKIDTQGFEREVLEGAGALLDKFRAVQLELPLRPLYQGQQDWREVVDFMSGRGFDIAMAKENGFDWDAMRLLELDVVFVARG